MGFQARDRGGERQRQVDPDPVPGESLQPSGRDSLLCT